MTNLGLTGGKHLIEIIFDIIFDIKICQISKNSELFQFWD